MRAKRQLSILLPLVALVASANPCFKLPKGFKPQSPAGAVAVLVVATPSPIVFSPIEHWQALPPEEIQRINDDLAEILVAGLKSKGVNAHAVPGGADALVYRSKGRICAKPDEVELIKSQLSSILSSSSLDSAIAVRLMVNRQQYHRIHMGQVVNREEAIVTKEGQIPLLYTANGEVHYVSKDGQHLNYFFVLDSWGIKPLGKNQFKLLGRSEWLSELGAQIITTLNGGPAVR